MMSSDKGIILSATTCSLLENIRLAIEVLTGTRVRFKEIELDKEKVTGHGRVFCGDVEKTLRFLRFKDTEIDIRLNNSHFSHGASFNGRGKVQVTDGSTKDSPLVWVGSSCTDRRQEPLLPIRDLMS